MTDDQAGPVIRLDKSKIFSECRGERTPDDPHYKVHFWQGTRVGKDIISLPFDAHGVLVPDDGKSESWEAHDNENKVVVFHPLYTQAMRDLVKRKLERMTNANVKPTAAEIEAAAIEEDQDAQARDTSEDVNLASWLRGEARYEWNEIKAAAKRRYSKNYTGKRELVVDLVLDEKVVGEGEVCAELKAYIPKA